MRKAKKLTKKWLKKANKKTKKSANKLRKGLTKRHSGSKKDKDTQKAFDAYSSHGWKGQYRGGPANANGKWMNKPSGNAQRLPTKKSDGTDITYAEFDIDDVKPRSARRLVKGSDGNVYYTNDHYKTFKRVEK